MPEFFEPIRLPLAGLDLAATVAEVALSVLLVTPKAILTVPERAEMARAVSAC